MCFREICCNEKLLEYFDMSRQRRTVNSAQAQPAEAPLPDAYEARLRTLGRTTGYGANLRAFQDSLKDVAGHYLGPLYDNVHLLWALFVICGLALSGYLLWATSTTDSAAGRESAVFNGLSAVCFDRNTVGAGAAVGQLPVDANKPVVRIIVLSRCSRNLVREAAIKTWITATAVQRGEVVVDVAVIAQGDSDCANADVSAPSAALHVFRIDQPSGTIVPPLDATGRRLSQPAVICPAAAVAAAAVANGKASSLASAVLGGADALMAQCEGALLLAAIRHVQPPATASGSDVSNSGPLVVVLRDGDAFPDVDAMLARVNAWKAAHGPPSGSASSSSWLQHAWISDHGAPFLAGEVVQRAARMLLRRDTAAALQARPSPPPSLLLTAAAAAVAAHTAGHDTMAMAAAADSEALQSLHNLAHRAGLLGSAASDQSQAVAGHLGGTSGWYPFVAAAPGVAPLFVRRIGHSSGSRSSSGSGSGSGGAGAQTAPRWPSLSLQLAALHAAPSLREDWGPLMWPAAAEAPHLLGPSLASFIATAALVLPAALPLGHGLRTAASAGSAQHGEASAAVGAENGARAGGAVDMGDDGDSDADSDSGAGEGDSSGMLGDTGARSALLWSLTRPRFSDSELSHALAASSPPIGSLLRRWLSGITVVALHDPGLMSSAEARHPRARAVGTALAAALAGADEGAGAGAGTIKVVSMAPIASVSTQLLHMLRPEMQAFLDRQNDDAQARAASQNLGSGTGSRARLVAKGGSRAQHRKDQKVSGGAGTAGSLRTRSGAAQSQSGAQTHTDGLAVVSDAAPSAVGRLTGAAIREALARMADVRPGQVQTTDQAAAALRLAHVWLSGSNGSETENVERGCLLGRCCTAA